VIDGNSTDGAKEFLQQLFNEGKIDNFLSEPDHNQADAWNKAFLLAKGTLIKKIIDDDVHDYQAIEKCKNFMLANNAIDICLSNDLQSSLNNPVKVWSGCRLEQYDKWKEGKVKSFTFSDLTILIRRSSLSFMGLFDTQFKMLDWEYALRVSYLQAGIAYYTGYNAMGITTPGNVTSGATKGLLKKEGDIGMLKYDYAGDAADISNYSHLKIWIGTNYKRLKAKKNAPGKEAIIPADTELQKIYAGYYKKLEDKNKQGEFTFIY